MRGSRISWAAAAAALVVVSTPAAAFNCYAIVDRSNEVIYQGALSPVDLSEDGAPARDALRARGQQLIAMDTDNCPAIDRINLATRGGPATVDEIVASPRLLPVLLLELLWLLGHDPVRRAAWRTLSARAIASGNPALDYIGTGGPTPLRIPA